MTTEIRELQTGITQVLVALGKVETEIKQLASMSVKLESTDRLTIQLEASLRAAHTRLDDLSKDLEGIKKTIEDDKKTKKDDNRWLLGFVPGAVVLAWKLFDFLQGGGK